MSKKQKNSNGKISYIFTRETFGMAFLLFSALVFLMLCSGSAIFAGIGKAVCTFMYGTFGFASFIIMALTAYLGVWLVFGKKIDLSFRKVLTISLTIFALFLLFHAVTTRNYSMDGYGKYLSECYFNAQNGFSGYTFGGVISAIIVYPVAKAGGYVTAYVLFAILALAFGYLAVSSFLRGKSKAVSQKETFEVEVVKAEVKPVEDYQQVTARTVVNDEEQEERDDKFSQKNLGRKILFEKDEFAAESYRRNMIFNDNSYFHHPVTSEADYLSSFTSNPKKSKTYTEQYQDEVYNQQSSMPSSYVYGEKPVDNLDGYGNNAYSQPEVPSNPFGENMYEPKKTFNDYNSTEPIFEEKQQSYNPYVIEEKKGYEPPIENMHEDEKEEPVFRQRERGAVGFTDSAHVESESENYNKIIKEDDGVKDDVYDFLKGGSSSGERVPERTNRSNSNLFDDIEDDGEPEVKEDIFASRRNEQPQQSVRPVVRREPLNPVEQVQEKKHEEKQEEQPKHVWKKYVRPSLDLLDNYPESSNVNTGEIEDNKRIIVETLERFKITSEVSNVTIGPAITRYDVIIVDKTKINQSLKYRDAIAMELKKDNVNAYLNYTKGALSIEVPNNHRAVVGLKGMLASQQFINSKAGSLAFALGKNVDGEVVCPDITKMPHLLVAGTTGSGKSVCLSALLVSLLFKYGPDELRLILVDPKQIEFMSYDGLPHLMINEIIYDCDKAIKALNWAIKEMERRYSLFKEVSASGVAVNNINGYNANLPDGEEKLPKIVIVLDEFGDLMLQAKKDIESRIIKLVQKARACGIHLILATQRPSVDCITGLIKSNLPTRIGFKVNSFDDARTIFDIGGAEKLLGMGDAYFRLATSPDLARIQCCFVDAPEVQRVTDFVKAHNETYFDQGVSDFINTVEQEDKPSGGMISGEEESNETKIDDTFIKALKYCVTSNQASVSMLQRRFPVGYIKACKIIDWMENMNYVTPSEGSKPRKVLLSKDEFFNIYGDVDD